MAKKRERSRQPQPGMPGLPVAPPSGGVAAPATSTSIPAPQVDPDEKQDLDTLINAAEQARSSKVIVYWLSDMAKISDSAIIPLYDQLSRMGEQDRIDLILYTRGGDIEIPWRVVTLIREFAKTFGVLIPYRAASSGTLIALGADEIVMTPLSVLGPIDPSRTHPLLPRPTGADLEPISVQDMRHAMQFIREAAGSDKEMPYTPEAMAQIFTALFDKVHPLAIGAIEQSYALSKLIGTRCLGTHMDPDADEAKIRSIVDKLCDEYKSHAYQISRAEARELGLKAVDAEPAVETAMLDLYKFYTGRPVLPPTPPSAGNPFQAHIAWLDATDLQMRVEGTYVADQDGKLAPQGDAWITY